MKKRWFVIALFALTLCLCATPAQAAVTIEGEEYLWYVKYGEILKNENYETVGYEGDSLWLSRDGGASYAELPGLREESRRTWGRMDAALTPLDKGGLRVEARDRCSQEYTWRRDYSAAELAKAFSKEEPNPVEKLAANERVAVGRRLVQDQENGDPSLPGAYGHSYNGERSGYRLVRSSDGVAWIWASEQPEDLGYYSELWWDGGVFWLSSGWSSPDGDHWAEADQIPLRNTLALTADLGRYHFEAVMPKDSSDEWYNEIYLMEGKERDKGVLLPHMGEGIRTNGIGINKMTASPGSNDTVVLTVSGIAGSFSLDYPTSSLDWCLENLSKPFREDTQPAAVASNGNGTVTLAKVAEHFRNGNTYEMEGELLRSDGTGWRKVEDAPFSPVFRLLPFNGKTFLVEDNAAGRHRLYASEDGLTWTEITALRPQDIGGSVKDYVQYAMTWTGSGYLACREAGNYGNRAGGSLYGGNTSVYLLDESFALTDAHDFGRIVQAVGFYEGNYYAQVSDSEGTRWQGVYHVSYDENGREIYNTDLGYYNRYAPATLYRSADGKAWEPLGKEYQLFGEEDLVSGGLAETYLRASGFPEPRQGSQPLHSVAVLDNWRFVLSTDNEVYLCKEKTVWWVQLPHIGEAIRASGITPGELTAAYTLEGTVEVKVTDRDNPSRIASVSYPPDSLNWVKENLDGIPADNWVYGYRNGQSKRDAVDVTVVHRGLGEREVLWRSAETNGQFTWYDSVPWSNRVTLLPYAGYEYLLLDEWDGTVYRSADGLHWERSDVREIQEMLVKTQ